MSDGYPTARPVNLIFALCLAFSIGLHIVSVLMIACIWSAPAGIVGASYLEMRDLVTASPDSAPVIRSTSSSSPIKAEQPQALPEPDPQKTSAPEQPGPESEDRRDLRTSPIGLGMSYGFVSSLGDGVTLREDIREYYLLLVERINKVWWERAATLTEAIRQDGIAVVMVLGDGTLVGRQIQRGTGSPEADRALLESIDRAAPMPPLPASYGRDVFTAPLKITAPLQLFRAAN